MFHYPSQFSQVEDHELDHCLIIFQNATKLSALFSWPRSPVSYTKAAELAPLLLNLDIERAEGIDSV